ncbi:MAG: hypothetical protein V7L23_27350 [Nostoc sp.]|uniref:hypothetical protein n=1 Tax=Nostoc sp. TaxID=1180 RepID=UPI002FEFB213
MAVNYTVQAEVVDIRSDSPNKDDIFLVDTNVWYWYTYTNPSISSRPYQIIEYPSYLAKAISVNSLEAFQYFRFLVGVEGLEPTRPFTVNGFSFSRSFHCYLMTIADSDFENWTLPLPST